MKPEYNDLLKSIIEDEILIIKYSIDWPTCDVQVKAMLHEWDTNHNLQTFHKWLNEQDDEIKQAVVGSIDPLWLVIYIRLHTVTDVILEFMKTYTKLMNAPDYQKLSEYEMIQIVVTAGITHIYEQGFRFLKKSKIPLFMQKTFAKIMHFFQKVLNKLADCDKILDHANELYIYLSSLILEFENTEFSLTDPANEAFDFIELIKYLATNFYVLLLIFEGFVLIEQNKSSIPTDNVFYQRTNEKEEKLERLKDSFLERSKNELN
ncbi:hypothetical protein [Williamsoniiplasma lucivorax]|uniref:Uncharacterized protein n=1 Tax=Williamsoniiplasma lucivorax TaxID=209274 RepID=A0A2S5RF28_9MOLU|nr:hypothetical protein [Williamsoniiplasma lucivorax]PPE05923.1 hypothetical protein ELUCI_v1c02140 [Williamsoniiplasma lucivorax]